MFYNTLGKEILKKRYKSDDNHKEILLPNVAKGIYIVRLESGNKRLNKKINIDQYYVEPVYSFTHLFFSSFLITHVFCE